MMILKEDRVLYEGKHVNFCSRKFIDKFDNEKEWEYVRRENNREAVIIVPNNEDKIVLVKQFRIPINKYTLELPAGLINANESVKDAALREFREETGYNCKFLKSSMPLCISPGISSMIIHFVDVEADFSERFTQELDDTEEIEIVMFERKNIKESIEKYLEENREVILDTKVYATFLCGKNGDLLRQP